MTAVLWSALPSLEGLEDFMLPTVPVLLINSIREQVPSSLLFAGPTSKALGSSATDTLGVFVVVAQTADQDLDRCRDALVLL